MNNMRNKILSLLVLLLTAATGAWATEPKVINSEIDFESLMVGDILVEGFSISGPYSTTFYFNAGRAKKGETLLNEDVSFFKGYISSVGTNTVITLSADAGDAAGIYTPIDENGQVGNSWIVTSKNHNNDFHLSGYTYVDPNAEAPITVEWNASTKTGTFSMPGSDVVLTPQYAPVAKWDVVETVEQKPAALEGIIAGQDEAIVTPGQSSQGTVMYAVTTTAEAAPALTAFSATVPTAKDYDDATTLYVWYYIKGQDTPDGQQATEENTFNDSEISATPLKVDILTNKFDITLSPAPVKNMTVTVAGQAKTPTDEGKLEAVKMQSEVKLKAATGYKFRKVEVKKGAAAGPPEYYDKLTKINDDEMDQISMLKSLGRGYESYNSSLTAAQAYALATYQAAIDGKPVYVIMSSQDHGYEIHYALSTDAAATEHTAELYGLCQGESKRMYYVAQ